MASRKSKESWYLNSYDDFIKYFTGKDSADKKDVTLNVNQEGKLSLSINNKNKQQEGSLK
ncbi:MAG: hypothetical protein NTZ75_03050 [Euryarchaeota archaeon]|nr:hypothetical protein [Euryarchaeota archaeon]